MEKCFPENKAHPLHSCRCAAGTCQHDRNDHLQLQEKALAYQQAIEMARSYANKFNGEMEINRAIGKTIYFHGNYDSSDRNEVNNMLHAILVTPSLLGTYVAYEPMLLME